MASIPQGFSDTFSRSIEEISHEIDLLEEQLSLQEESLRLEQQSGKPGLSTVDIIQEKILTLTNLNSHDIAKKISDIENQITNLTLETSSNRSYLRDSSSKRKLREHYGKLGMELADCRRRLHRIRDHASILSKKIDSTQKKIVLDYSESLLVSDYEDSVLETSHAYRNIDTLLNIGKELGLAEQTITNFRKALIKYARGSESNELESNSLPDAHLFLKTVREMLKALSEEAPSALKSEKVSSLKAIEQIALDVCSDFEECFRSRIEFLKDFESSKVLIPDLEVFDENITLEYIQNCHDIFWEFESPIDTSISFNTFINSLENENLFKDGEALEDMKDDVDLVKNKMAFISKAQENIKHFGHNYLYDPLLNRPFIREKMIEYKAKYLQKKRDCLLEKYKRNALKAPVTSIIGSGPGALTRGLVACCKGADTKIIQDKKAYPQGNKVGISPSKLLSYFGTLDRLVDKGQVNLDPREIHVQMIHLEEALYDSLQSVLGKEAEETFMLGFEFLGLQIGKNEEENIIQTGVIVRSNGDEGNGDRKVSTVEQESLSRPRSLEERIAFRERHKAGGKEAFIPIWIPSDYVIDATGCQDTSAFIIDNETTPLTYKAMMVAAIFKDVERGKRKNRNPESSQYWSLSLKTAEREYLLIRPTEMGQVEIVESQRELTQKKSRLQSIHSIKDSMDAIADKLSFSLKKGSEKYSEDDLATFQASLTQELTVLQNILNAGSRTKKLSATAVERLSLDEILKLHKEVRKKSEKVIKGLEKSIRNGESSVHDLVEKIALKAAKENPDISRQINKRNIEHLAPFSVEAVTRKGEMLFGDSLLLSTEDVPTASEHAEDGDYETAILGGSIFSRLLDNHMIRRKPVDSLPLYSFAEGNFIKDPE